MVDIFQSTSVRTISCVICHMKIVLDEQGELGSMNQANNYVKCPNGHAVHIEPCLTNWIIQSEYCPVCNTKYSDVVLAQFKTIIEKIKKEKEALSSQQAAMEAALDDVEFFQELEQENQLNDKLQRSLKLMDNKKYEAALNLLFDILDNDDPKNLDAKFLIGKAHYLNGNYAMAVSNLMKLVKIKFDYPFAFYYLGKSFQCINLKDKADWSFERSRNNLKKIVADPEIDEVSRAKYNALIEEITKYLGF